MHLLLVHFELYEPVLWAGGECPKNENIQSGKEHWQTNGKNKDDKRRKKSPDGGKETAEGSMLHIALINIYIIHDSIYNTWKSFVQQEKLRKAALKAEAAELKKIEKEKQKWEKGKFAIKSIVAEIDTKVVESGSIGGRLMIYEFLTTG